MSEPPFDGPAAERIRRLVSAARRLADPSDPIGARAREILPSSTGLSPAGVALALERCLETAPSDAELARLIQSVEPAPAAHVLLSSNVFTGAHRALALALAQSARVVVRPSRREPDTVRLLSEAGGPFEIADELRPTAGDHLWIYGRDETLDAVAQEAPESVVIHRHGSGMGIVLLDLGSAEGGASAAIVRDVVPFDQRGCLSPRLVLAVGRETEARTLAAELARELEQAARLVPPGPRSADELADLAQYRDTVAYGGELRGGVGGFVGCTSGVIVIPPVGRNLHVTSVDSVEQAWELVAPLCRELTAVGISSAPRLFERVEAELLGVRICALGRMQTPPFDGPVDRRDQGR